MQFSFCWTFPASTQAPCADCSGPSLLVDVTECTYKCHSWKSTSAFILPKGTKVTSFIHYQQLLDSVPQECHLVHPKLQKLMSKTTQFNGHHIPFNQKILYDTLMGKTYIIVKRQYESYSCLSLPFSVSYDLIPLQVICSLVQLIIFT